MRKYIIILLLCSIVLAADKPYRILNSFNAGELSPLLTAREDLAKFQSGCSLMENMIPLPQGGAQKRPGTIYVAGSKEDTKIRLLPFQFSTTQSYIIELGNQYMRFFTDRTVINTGGGTEDLSALSNIVAHWLLNDVLPDTVVVDDDGATHNGTATANTETLSVDGKVGVGAFDLDGQYAVAMTDDDNFSFDDSGANPFSLACWAYVTQQADIQTLVSKWKEATAREWRFSVSDELKLQLHLCDDSISVAGTVSHYKLNDNAANTAVDDDIALQDGVATANTNTLFTTGVISGAFDFGGAQAVEIAAVSEHSFGNGSVDSAFSIAAWVYLEDTGDDQDILTKYSSNSGSELREWRFYAREGAGDYRPRIILYDESANATINTGAPFSLSAGWHFIVVTYDGGGTWETVEFYIDGVHKHPTGHSSTGTYVAMEYTATKVVIGASYNTSGNLDSYWENKIDNVAIFDVELTQASVTNLWNSGNGTETLNAIFPNAIADNAMSLGWHYFCATYTGAGGAAAATGIILYVDGAAVDSTKTNEATYVAMENTATTPKIGCQESATATNEKFWGDKIDEVFVVSSVLSASEISTLYNETPYEIDTPYLTVDLPKLKYEQSADVLYISHPDYETEKLQRYGDVAWELDALGVENGPFRAQNTVTSGTIYASATTGSVTLTATDCTPFVDGTTAGHEPSGFAATSKSKTGALFRLIHPLTTLEYSETLSDNYTDSKVENTSWMDCGTVYKGATWTLVTAGTWTGTLHIQRNYTVGAAHNALGWEDTMEPFASTDDRNVNTTGTEDWDAASYRAILKESGDAAEPCKAYFSTDQTEHSGIVKITSVANPTSAIGTVLTTLGSTVSTHKWSEGSWSNYRGWPQTVTFFEDRLIFGGNASQPDTVWGSVTSDYENMLEGVEDDDAILFTLSSKQVNAIQWLVGKDKILIGTSGAEWTLAGSADEPLTPSSVKAEQHSSYGSANLQAVLANESVLFFQQGAERMRELAYNWELDSYVAPDMTILSKEITGNGITDTAFQQIPDAILWCVKENGDLATFSYERKENITAWSRQITDGDFESVAVIHGDAEDEVWVSAARVISGTVRYIEYFSPRDFGDDPCDAFYVDCGMLQDATATTAVSGLTHLEGETVYVLGDGAVLGTEVVSGGAITIDTASAQVRAGLPYTVQMKTMPLSWIAQGMTIHGRIKRISEVVASWYESGDFSIGRDADTLETYVLSGHTTDEDRKTFPPGYDRYGYVFIYQKSPEPLTVLAVMMTFMVQ